MGHVDRGIKGSLIEANVCDQIDLENSAIGIIITWGQGIWLMVARGVLAEHFSGAFQGLAYGLEPTPRRRGDIQTDAPHIIVRASVGDAAGASVFLGQHAYLCFEKILQVCLEGQQLRIRLAIMRVRSVALDALGVFSLEDRRRQGWLKAPCRRQRDGLWRPS